MAKRQTKKASRNSIRWATALIVVVFLVGAAFDMPSLIDRVESRVGRDLPIAEIPDFHLGLDLQGGAHLVYEADMRGISFNERSDRLAGVRDVIERRVNAFGVGEPRVQTNVAGDNHRIIVELPGVVDVQEAIAQIGETPLLEFKEANPNPQPELTNEQQNELSQANTAERVEWQGQLQQVLSGTKSFEDVVLISNDTETKENGGSLGFISSIGQQWQQDLHEFAKTAPVGRVAPRLAETERGFHIVRVTEREQKASTVSANHILICYQGIQTCASERNRDEALSYINSIREDATPDNFAELAELNSDDPTAADNKGDLGAFATGYVTPVFENTAFEMEVGTISDVVETEFGYHLIYKYEEDTELQYNVEHSLFEKTRAVDIAPEIDPWLNTKLSGAQLERATVQFDHQTGDVQVALDFDDEGADLFAEITGRNVGSPVAIFLDGQVISSPTVQQRITGGQAVIHGNFGVDEAKLLTQRLNAGALPLPVNLVSQSTVGPTLGQISLDKSLKAALIGFILILIFMMLYYRLPGILAGFGLLLYVILVLAVFKMVPVTLTLAGVAGFILSLGMAVDANVLIFERVKEELKEGKSYSRAITLGFERAWTSIRDGNVSTLITCAILYWFGTSIVRGFAITLSVGVLLSMFSAITITRVLMRFIEPWINEGSSLVLGSKKK